MELLRRPENLEKLTLKTVKFLDIPTSEELAAYLGQNYSDFEIEKLVGQINDELSRQEFLNEASSRLVRGKAYLLTSEESELCRNDSSILGDFFEDIDTVYLGLGNLAQGLTCYVIDELIENFNHNTSSDGVVLFRDPQNYERNFSLKELEAIRDVLRSGRSGYEIPQNFIKQFEEYVQIHILQNSADFKTLGRLRSFANQSDENSEKIRKVFMSYFRTGMYMRQWKGPGNPYPIQKGDTGSEQQSGTDREVQISTNVTEERSVFIQSLENLPKELQTVIWDLDMYNLNSKSSSTEPEKRQHTIEGLFERVSRGKYCIRMASGPWAYTGAYYLKQILNEDIPGFELSSGIRFIY